MKKLTLKIDALAIESFETAKSADALLGTVEAHGALRTQPRELCKTILTYCPCTPRAGEPFEL
jgi:hypothetical protein